MFLSEDLPGGTGFDHLQLIHSGAQLSGSHGRSPSHSSHACIGGHTHLGIVPETPRCCALPSHMTNPPAAKTSWRLAGHRHQDVDARDTEQK